MPPSCINDPEQVCIRGDEKAYEYRWIFAVYITAASFIIIPLNMVIIICAVWKQKRKGDKWRLRANATESDERWNLIIRLRNYFKRENDEMHNGQTSALRLSSFVISSEASCNEDVIDAIDKSHIPVDLSDLPRKQNRRLSFPVPPARFPASAENDIKNEQNSLVSSRSGTSKDPLSFDLHKVRRSIRRESLVSVSASRRPSLQYSRLSIGSDEARHARRSSLYHPRSSIGSDDTRHTRRSSLHRARSSISSDDAGQARRSSLQHTKPSAHLTDKIRVDRNHITKGVGKSDEAEVTLQALFYIMAYIQCWMFPFAGR